AEDGIRDFHVTGVQTCALPIYLLFMHWRVPAESLRRLIPPGLDLDLFEGEAWIGVVPFRMSGVRPRFLPGLPGLSAFPELNVRRSEERRVGKEWEVRWCTTLAT